MKTFMLLVVHLVVYSCAATAQAAGAEERRHVRALDALSAATLAHAMSGSAVVRELVSALDASDVIVHIETPPALPAGLSGTTRFAGSTPTYRYVRTALDRDLPLARRAAILGHELQHAWEIAQSPARDRAAVRILFSSIGWHYGTEAAAFETDAAAAVGEAVWRELRRRNEAPATGRASAAEQK